MFGVPNTMGSAAVTSESAPGGTSLASGLSAVLEREPRTSELSAIETAALCKKFGTTEVLVDASLRVRGGSVVALLGPSGCGKTTLLRLLAGLEAPDSGTINIAGIRVAGDGTFVPPEKRKVGLVFQDWALFPHLTVEANVAYGVPRGAQRPLKVAAALELVGLTGFERRMPGTLSGGQQQRVALARAVASEPAVLLLDEPFSNLDTSLRTLVRSEIHELLIGLGITTVVVTHDQEEAFILGDEVAILHEGRIVQQAPPAEVYSRPASRWVANFVGEANLVPALAAGDHASTPLGDVRLLEAAAGPVDVLLRPEGLRIISVGESSQPPHGVVRRLGEGNLDLALSGSSARVDLVEFYGHDTITVVSLPDGTRLRVRSAGSPPASRGDSVRLAYTNGPVVSFSRDA